MNIAELFVRVTADVAGLERGMARAQRSIERAGEAMQTAGQTLSVGLTAPLVAFGAAAVVNATKLDSLTRALEAVAAPGEDVAKQLERLREVAKLPGLGFEEAIQGSVNLQAVGFSAAEAERTLRAFGNAIASTGGGKAELDRVTTQLTQMASAGRILTADLRPIIQTSPLVAKALQQAFGTIDAQKIEDLGLTFDQFFEQLVTQLEGLPQVASGPKVAFEGLADSFTVASGALGARLMPAVIAITTALSKLLEGVASLDPVTQNFIIAFGAAAAALGPVLLAVGTLIKLLPVLQSSMALLIGVGGPVLLGVAAFGALAAAGLALVQNWEVIKFEVGALVDRIHEALVGRLEGIVNFVGEKTEAITGFFRDMYEKVVGHSYVPDMVERIGEEFTKMGGIFEDGTRAIIDFSNGSRDAIRSFVQQAIADLTRLLLKMAAVRGLEAIFGDSLGGVGGLAMGLTGGGLSGGAPLAIGGAPSSHALIEGLPPLERPLTPREASRDAWWSEFIRAGVAADAARG